MPGTRGNAAFTQGSPLRSQGAHETVQDLKYSSQYGFKAAPATWLIPDCRASNDALLHYKLTEQTSRDKMSPKDCLMGKVYADLCSERHLEKGSGGVGAQPPRKS